MSKKIACIEAGGTKFVCAIGNLSGEIEDRISIPTTTPQETMALVIEYFDKFKGQFDKLSIGTFGPAQINQRQENWGSITTTPKPHWAHFNMIAELKKHYAVQYFFDTDVNVAAAGEYKWGAAQGLNSCLYITVGTGVGAGAIVNGQPLQGISHPEMGHIMVKRHPQDNYQGYCPYHKDCLEGMISGPAVEDRWQTKAIDLEVGHQAWEFNAYYIAQALVNYILILSPERIIIGGGVMKQLHLFPLIHKNVQEMLAGYLEFDQIMNNIDQYIVPPKLGDNSGVCGTIAMTML